MPAKKLTLDPDVILEWLLDRGYVEPTSSPSHPYRISANEEDFLPYSVTFLTKKLSESFSKVKLKSTNRKAWRKELYKCFDVHQILCEDRGTRGNMHWEFKMTARKWLEQKLGIDLEIVDQYDLNHKATSNRGGKRWQSYWRNLKKRYSEEDALKFFREYFDRRMSDLSKNLCFGKRARLTNFAQKQPSKELK